MHDLRESRGGSGGYREGCVVDDVFHILEHPRNTAISGIRADFDIGVSDRAVSGRERISESSEIRDVR